MRRIVPAQLGRRLLPLIVVATLLGCQSGPPTPKKSPDKAGAPHPGAPRDAASDAGEGEAASGRPVAYVDARALTDADLRAPLYEAAGGRVLADLVLDRAVAQALADRGLSLEPADLEAEKRRLLETLSDDPDTAARLLGELRITRGLGKVRLEALLRRSAGLRRLVADRVAVTDAAIKRQYLLRHGPRYRVRLLVTATADEASRLRRRAMEGGSFSDLAAMHSIDPSAAQGGLLSPISPADTSYPQAVRNALPKLGEESGGRGGAGGSGGAGEAGAVSPVLALGDRFAVLKLEDKIEADGVALDDVRDELVVAVRRRSQRLLMEQQARELLAAAEVVVLDPALKAAWQRHRARLLEQP